MMMMMMMMMVTAMMVMVVEMRIMMRLMQLKNVADDDIVGSCVGCRATRIPSLPVDSLYNSRRNYTGFLVAVMLSAHVEQK